MNLETITVGEKMYLTVTQFAKLTDRTISSVWKLIYTGNRIRKLQAERLCGHVLIPLEEVTSYPFTFSGDSLTVCQYRWNEERQQYLRYICDPIEDGLPSVGEEYE